MHDAVFVRFGHIRVGIAKAADIMHGAAKYFCVGVHYFFGIAVEV